MPVQLSGSLLMSGSITATGTITAQGGVSSAGAQYISDTSNAISFTSTASLYTDGGLRVSKDSYVSGTAYFNNVVVYGTSSIEYITSSQVNIGSNLVVVNTDTPAIRFGGLAVYDSGSTGLTGSMLWDSEANHWVYANPSGSTYSGGMMISGPRAASLGTEVGTTACAVMIGQGGDHITSSGIFSYGNATCFYGNTVVSSSGTVCTTMANADCIGIGTTSPAGTLHAISTSTFQGIFNRVGGSAGNITFRSARGTVSSLTTSNPGDIIFQNSYAGYDGTNFQNAGMIAVGLDSSGTICATSMPGYLRFSTTPNGSVTVTERLRITSDGIACFACQVCTGGSLITNGIIDINSNSVITNVNDKFSLGVNSTCYAWMQSYGGRPLYINALGNNVLLPNNTTRLGIGTCTPSAKLHIDMGSISSDTNTIHLSSTDASGTNKWGIVWYSGTGADFRGKVMADNNGKLYLDSIGGGGVILNCNGGSGNVGIGIASPAVILHVCGSTLPCFNTTGVNNKFTITEVNDGNSNAGLRIQKRYSTTHPANYWYGDIQFAGWDGSQFLQGALIEAVAQGTPSSNNMPGNLRFSTNGGSSSVTERLRITSTGIACFACQVCAPVIITSNCIGIGGTPSFKLDVVGQVSGGTETIARIGNVAGVNNGLIIYQRAANSYEYSFGCGTICLSGNLVTTSNAGIGTTNLSAEANLFLGAQGTTEGGQLVLQKGTSCNCATHLDNYKNQFRILGGSDTASTTEWAIVDMINGNVGIGTSPALYKLDVGLPSGTNGQIIRLGRSGGAYYWSLGIDGTGSCLNFYNNSNTSVAVINPTTGVYTATSDIRLKECIQDSENSLDKIMQLKVRKYNWKDSDMRESYGFIAQEVRCILPEYVAEGNDETYWKIAKSEFVPILVKAIQEQQCKIKTLESCLGIN